MSEVVTVAEAWPHEQEGVSIPMPEKSQLFDMRREFYQRVNGQGIGPSTTAWRDAAFAWAKQLRTRFFGDSKQVTGLWPKAAHRFRKRLRYLEDRELAKTVMREVEQGVRLPFGEVPGPRVPLQCCSRRHPHGLRLLWRCSDGAGRFPCSLVSSPLP